MVVQLTLVAVLLITPPCDVPTDRLRTGSVRSTNHFIAAAVSFVTEVTARVRSKA